MSFENLYDPMRIVDEAHILVPSMPRSLASVNNPALVEAFKRKHLVVPESVTVPESTYFSAKIKEINGKKLIGFIRAGDGGFQELGKHSRGLRADYYKLRQKLTLCQVAAWVYAKCN